MIDNVDLNRRQFLSTTVKLAALSLIVPGLPSLAAPIPTPGGRACVDVACGNILGKADEINRFLGLGDGDGGQFGVEDEAEIQKPSLVEEQRPHYDFESYPSLTERWHELGLTHMSRDGLDGEVLGVKITTDGAGRYKSADFSKYGARTRFYTERLGVAVPLVSIPGILKEFSPHPDSPAYMTYMPRNMCDWQRFLGDLARFNRYKLGLKGLYYVIGLEHHSWICWRGSGNRDAKIRLKESVKYIQQCARAITKADPTALVGNSAEATYKRVTPDPHDQAFDLNQWLREFARQSQQTKAVLGFVTYQDYCGSSDRIADGARTVRDYLVNAGLKYHTPILLAGAGNGAWSTPHRKMPSHQRASFLARTLLEEFADPRKLNFALAQNYPGRDTGADEITDSMPLIYWKDGQGYTLNKNAAVFQMFSKSRQGLIVDTDIQASMTLRGAAAKELQAMAVRNDASQTVTAIINNHSGSTSQIDVNFKDVKTSVQTAKVTIQLVDDFNGDTGLGAGESITVERERGGTFKVPVNLRGFAIARVTLSLSAVSAMVQ